MLNKRRNQKGNSSLSSNPTMEYMDLSNQNLQSIDAFTHQILTNPCLKTINLQHNSISRLFMNGPPPANQVAAHIEGIDLRDNQICDLLYTISEEIIPMFPCLKDLKLNLYDEDHVDFIMKNMPQLEFLNGLPVEREDYEED